MALFKVNGKDFGGALSAIQLKLVRTYKGEIGRTQTGRVAAFPLSFVTVGFDAEFFGYRYDMNLLQQLMLSNDVLTLVTDYNGTTIKGAFSCTSNEYTEVRDKHEMRTQLRVSLVSDGTDITKEDGSMFKVRLASSTGTQITSGAYGKVVTVGAQYKKNGAYLPQGKLLLLGDEIVTT